ncbi:hypothetical protein BDFB_001110 [Asbolus verrucosus]|uniref:Uncharacterized protein n=1 Tax=Asbolus verrucosus TaxID=1661398 RepID=A0A482W3T3_ASBVE|nr:hypothetical protein BDFB_001110 [Asbolus verrucosus]
MATLTRSTSRTTPAYKEYVNFLEGYKNGRKDEGGENSDSGVSVKNFSLANSSNSTSSSSVNSDVTDFSKSSCIPYNTYLENSKNKKFNPVKPALDEKSTKKSEIFIEIKPRRSVSEVSKMFENKEGKLPPMNAKISSKVNIFEKQISTENKPKIAPKPSSPPPKIEIEVKIAPPVSHPPAPPMMNGVLTPPPPPPMMNVAPMTEVVSAPPPPPLPTASPKKVTSAPPPTMMKTQATLVNGPPVRHTVNNPNGVIPTTIDRNDPMVKKLVYGTLRGLYGAYHDKANDMMATLPKDRVKKSHGVQGIIEQIA